MYWYPDAVQVLLFCQHKHEKIQGRQRDIATEEHRSIQIDVLTYKNAILVQIP